MIKTIYFFWYQGIENAPKIVKQCLKSWKYYNPTWNIVLLEQSNYKSYLDTYDIKLLDKMLQDKIVIYRISDIMRLMLLYKHGGLWVDSTCFCNCSLDNWLSSCIKYNGIFLFENLTPIHKKISNWFIYSEKEHYLINKWIIAALNYYDSLPQQYKDIYFIFHDIFEHLCEEDAVFLDYFDRIHKTGQNDNMMYFNFDKRLNLYVKSEGFLSPLTDEIREIIINKEKYLFKLSHKCTWPDNIDGTIVSFLFSTIG